MARIIELTGLDAPELAVFAGLTETQLRRRREPEQGILIAESLHVIEHALDAGCEPLALLMERRKLETIGARLSERCGDIPLYTGDDSLLAGLTGYQLTRGVLCAMRRPAVKTVREVLKNACRVAVLEDITDAANVGALFRSAAALGMDAVLLSPGCCDPLCRRAARVSMGTVFQIPWARFTDEWPRESLAVLRGEGFRSAALALTDRSVPVDDPSLAPVPKLALLLGTEGTGLKQETVESCDVTVRIPMAHGVDSLNVAAAGAVAFWQLRAPGYHENGGKNHE